jgi:hypothetical protein
MTEPVSAGRQESSLVRDWLYAASFYVGRRNMILILAALAIAGGIAMNWNWLVASALAPIVIALLPCAVMCGLGLCAHKLFGASGANERPRRTLTEEQTEELSAPSDSAAINSVSDCCNDAAKEAAPVQIEPPSDDERRDSNA